jgi:hypothetical protein
LRPVIASADGLGGSCSLNAIEFSKAQGSRLPEHFNLPPKDKLLIRKTPVPSSCLVYCPSIFDHTGISGPGHSLGLWTFTSLNDYRALFSETLAPLSTICCQERGFRLCTASQPLINLSTDPFPLCESLRSDFSFRGSKSCHVLNQHINFPETVTTSNLRARTERKKG